MKKGPVFIFLLCLAVALCGIWYFYTFDTSPRGNNSGADIACPMDAKLCPDGSSVARTGPNCTFAKCPAFQSGTSATLETKIDKGATALGVTIVPLAILEDSRCPLDVQCIQAGTVRVRALLKSGLGEAVQEFTLATLITTEAELIEMVEVRPAPYSEVPIDAHGYTFVFKVTKR